MAYSVIYQAGVWHELHESKNIWIGKEPLTLIIPEHEDKRNVATAFAYLNPNAILTIPELIARYVQSRYILALC